MKTKIAPAKVAPGDLAWTCDEDGRTRSGVVSRSDRGRWLLDGEFVGRERLFSTQYRAFYSFSYKLERELIQAVDELAGVLNRTGQRVEIAEAEQKVLDAAHRLARHCWTLSSTPP